MDPNEAARPRADLIREAIEKDEHFEYNGSSELPFDLRFVLRDEDPIRETNLCNISELVLHVEVKDFSEDHGSDYLSSIISGHLWEQCLAARELGEPVIIAVLGDDRDVNDAIKTAASRNHRVDAKKLFQYFQMVDGFEANCIGLGIQVWRLKTDPFRRLLLRARKILEGGDLSGFAPRPAPGERKAVALSILAGDGIGATKAKNILQKFDLCLMVKDGCLAELEDCSGIGPKLASRIRENIEVVD